MLASSRRLNPEPLVLLLAFLLKLAGPCPAKRFISSGLLGVACGLLRPEGLSPLRRAVGVVLIVVGSGLAPHPGGHRAATLLRSPSALRATPAAAAC